MTAKLTTPMNPMNYEAIRDRVASILAIELSEQSELMDDSNINATVIGEKIGGVIYTNEKPVVNVMLAEVDFADTSQIKATADISILIEVYTKAASTADDEGDRMSAIRNWQLAGIIWGILSAPVYKTLDFSLGNIERKHVDKIRRTVPRNQGDRENSVMTVIEMTVRCGEYPTPQQGVAFDANYTTVEIELTGNGFEYIYKP